ncbi:ABC transporter permease [Suttonella ornithocola]|uniref:Aliphatic sulfonates transport permease protein ssuC n=1 Tax=Suttonella ornithocola TaxID=279832 RepID=A0A380MN75_9GAMM|nr:ABC transporter permease subunit [Suttonella ornithocola]SUO93191.1 Putative aliphatic sulfonates transport permease protein ssuC [Suttonella ornithocola]
MLLEQGFLAKRSRFSAIVDYLMGAMAAASSLCVLLALWQLAAEYLGALVLPEPKVVFYRMAEILATNSGWETLGITIFSGLLGVIIACIVGISSGFIAGWSRTVAVFFRPWITVLLGTPPIIWVILALFWFSQGVPVTLFTVSIAVTPMLFAAAMMSLITRPKSLLEMAKVYQLPWLTRIHHIWLPHLSQSLMPAIIVATGTGLKLTVMAELLGGSQGIGAKIADARTFLDTVEVLAYVCLIISIIMFIEYGVLEPIKRFILPDMDAR